MPPTIEDRARALEEMLAQRGEDGGEWLRAIYEAEMQRFLSDNERIWTTAALLIPLSFGAFAALVAMDSPGIGRVSLLALASITAYLVWLTIAERHRHFQDESNAWIHAIHQVIGIRLRRTGPTPTERIGSVRQMRWSLLVLLVLMWALTLLAVARGWLT